MRKTPTLLLAGAGSLLALAISVMPVNAESYACNGDPMYARNVSGKTIMGARIRNQPCMSDSIVVTVAPSGASLQVLAEMDGWYKVKYGETVGWMGSWLVKTGAALSTSVDSDTKPTPAPVTKTEVKKNNPAIELPKGIPQIIGVTEQSFNKIKKLDQALVKRLKGLIVMRVQSRGELYYVTAQGPQFLEVKKLAELDNDDLTIAQVAKPTASSGSLKLNAETADGKVILRWDVNGLDAPDGFKLVVAEHSGPVYPGNDYQYLSDPAARSHVWTGLEPGKKYYFRACQYLSGKCGVYSNEVVLTLGGQPVVSSQSTISLTGNVSGGEANLQWSLTGFESALGFKVVSSASPNPVYPGNDYHYLSDKSVRSDSWDGMKSGQTYHFRVCQYLGGKCGIYSNDLTVFVP